MRRAAIILMFCSGCVDARSGAGAECARNSQCAAPLVCALQHCRNECNSTRDCPVGAACVRSELGFGVCQLEDEVECTSDTDCPDTLVCRFDTCTNTCESVTCPPGAECRDGACFDPLGVRCETDLDCGGGLACIDGRCLQPCRSSRDCRFGSACVDGDCVPSDPVLDSGMTDNGGGADMGVDAADASVPFCEPPELTAMDVAVGERHACVLVEDGTVWCWGDSVSGQLGNAALAMADTASSAIRVDRISDATAVALGHSHSLALHADGSVSCWGDHTRGQCGVGMERVIPAPERIVAVSGVDELAPGRFATCMLRGEDVLCMGDQGFNALANGVTSGRATTPVAASELSPTRVLGYHEAAGYAVAITGESATWGSPYFGPGPPVPAYEQPTFTDATQVVMGTDHVCLLRPSGEVHCAGDNSRGQLGDPSRGASSFAFAIVPTVSAVEQISGSDQNVCARTGSGAVFCWGANQNGTLGVGDMSDRDSPTEVMLPGPATDISTGRIHSCAVVDGLVYCFGIGNYLGFYPLGGDTTRASRPVECLP